MPRNPEQRASAVWADPGRFPALAVTLVVRQPNGLAVRRATLGYMAASTSYRISDRARDRLARHADREGLTVTALLERLIIEGTDAIEHPGIIYRGPANDRRAALAGGPDVWEVVARLRELTGSQEARIRQLAEETDLHPRAIRTAVDFAAAHPEPVISRIDAREEAVRRGQAQARARDALLA